jgi:hypothetical protein
MKLVEREEQSKTPQVELKPLPQNLRYEFLGPNETYAVIVGAHLNETQTTQLLQGLNAHCKAIGYTIDDIKGHSPTVCMHRILMKDDQNPIQKPQRRLTLISRKWSERRCSSYWMRV